MCSRLLIVLYDLQVSTSLKTCNAGNKIKTPMRYCFATNFVFTCEGLLFFRGIISKFFTWTAVTNNTFEIHRNTSYCYPLKYKYNKWILLVNMKFSTKILAFWSPYFMRYKFSMIMKLEVHVTTINLNNVIFFIKIYQAVSKLFA